MSTATPLTTRPTVPPPTIVSTVPPRTGRTGRPSVNRLYRPLYGLAFTPNAEAVVGDADDTDAVDKIQLMDDLLENPDVKEALLGRIEDE